jgi:hypothetical protein
MEPRPALFALAGLLALTSCATRPPIPKASAAPFDLVRDLGGSTVARGEFSTVLGVRRGFTATLDGRMDGKTFVLAESFAFDDGEKDIKTWRLTPDGSGRWVGVREDVVGQAVGYTDGEAFRLEYLVDIKRKNGKSTRVRFRDVLVRTASGDVLNRAVVAYRGVPVGKVELLIKRPPGA